MRLTLVSDRRDRDKKTRFVLRVAPRGGPIYTRRNNNIRNNARGSTGRLPEVESWLLQK